MHAKNWFKKVVAETVFRNDKRAMFLKSSFSASVQNTIAGLKKQYDSQHTGMQNPRAARYAWAPPAMDK